MMKIIVTETLAQPYLGQYKNLPQIHAWTTGTLLADGDLPLKNLKHLFIPFWCYENLFLIVEPCLMSELKYSNLLCLIP